MVRIHHIEGSLSDHCPLPLWIRLNDENIRFYKRNRPFYFEAVWLKDERCEGVIKDALVRQKLGNLMQKVMGKIDACSTSLRS